MSKPISLRIGNFLYKNFYPVYNVVYPIFKNRQDAEEINWLKQTIKPGDTILDIGANIGFYSKILSNCVGSGGKIHAFEPDTTNFKHLSNNLKGFTNVVLNNMAVSDAPGEIKIYRSKDLNVDHRTYPVGDYESVDIIKAISIDAYIDGAFKVDLIKMDIQGYEVAALNGMAKTIENNPQIRLLLEFWPHGLHAAGNTVALFYETITNLGLKIQFLEHGQTVPFDPSEIPQFEGWQWGQYKNILLHKP